MGTHYRAYRFWTNSAALLALSLSLVCLQTVAEPLPPPGARIAIAGDSITQQVQYSRMIETYLHVCVPQLDASVIQLGWSGERAAGFDRRLANDLLFWSPDLVTLLYGMNDGAYQPYRDELGESYRIHLSSIIDQLQGVGSQVLVATPPMVDSQFRGSQTQADAYNETLATLAAIAREVTDMHGLPLADVHTTMAETLASAREVLGDTYHIAGPDGVHPQENGHLIIAYTLLDAMGFSGEIGTFTVNWDGEAMATEGHTVQSYAAGRLTVESRRYPFCFRGTLGSANGTAGVLPFLAFNRDLNRMTLVVRDLPAEAARVRWGQDERQFTRDQLAIGINLADHFLMNPFQEPFLQVNLAVAAKQRFEITMIKELISNFAALRERMPDDESLESALELVQDRLLEQQELLTAEIKAMVRPVTHTIIITPVTD